MNILRLSTLSLVLAIAVITFAISADGWAKPKCDDPPCGGGGGGGGGDSKDATYSVVFGAPIPGSSNEDAWGGGRKSIGFGLVFVDETTTLDLKFFHDLEETLGVNCFADIDDPFDGAEHIYNLDIHMQIWQGRRGRAETQLQFFANPVGDITPLYELRTIGFFEETRSGWPPSESGDDKRATLLMTDWEMRLANGQEEFETGACVGNDEFDDPWTIDVSLDET